MTPMTIPPAPGIGPKSLEPAMLRILNAHHEAVGMGFLVTDVLALTCAHVVTAALGAEPAPASAVIVDLPLPSAPGLPFSHTTAHVEPVPTSVQDRDLTLLRLSAPLPGSRPVRLVEVANRDVWHHTARAFGLPAGRPGGVWHAGVLRAPQGDGWVQLDLDMSGAGYRVSRGFSGSPVWDDELSAVVGMVTVAESGEPPASFLIPTDTLLAGWPEVRARALPRSPFRSLIPFEEGDAEIFHGRPAESAEVAKRIAANSWTAVVGPSGSGKSSLVRAGVVPLRRRDGDCPVVIRPFEGASPLAALAGALLPLLEPDLSETRRLAGIPELTAVLAVQGLRNIAARVLKLQGANRLLVVVDQFEELLDERRCPAEAVAALSDVLFDEPSLPDTVRVLTTLRADFLDAALSHPRLGTVVRQDRTYTLTPMRPEQLDEIIAKPIENMPGVAYEVHLAKRILADAGTEPGALPLLGFTLDQLWQRQSGGLLTLRAYEDLGAVTGALRSYAQRTWTEYVSTEDEAAADGLLTQLVRVPIGAAAATRRIVPRTELGEDAWRIAQKLAVTRLLVINGSGDGETVELAHEALITAWDRLAARVTADRTFLGWRESVRHDMDRWRQGGGSTELLPGPLALAGAKQWLRERGTEVSAAERDYLQLGRIHSRWRARRRRSAIALLCVLALAAATISVVSVRLNDDTARTAAAAHANSLAADAAALAATDPGLGGQLAIAAYRISPTPAAVSQLYATLDTPLDSAVENTGDAILQTTTQTDGPLAAVMDENGSLRIWNTANPTKPILDATIHTQASAVALAPRSALLAAACPTAKALCLWNLADPQRPTVLSQLPTDFGAHTTTVVDSMAVSPDGTVLAAAGENGQTFLWSIAQPAHPRPLTYLDNPAYGALDDLSAVAFAPRGALLATTTQDGETELWNLADPSAPASVATISTGYQSVAFSPDGSLLAAAGDTNIGLWRLQDPTRPASIDINENCDPEAGSLDFSTAAFSPGGEQLSFSGTDTDDSKGELCTLSLSANNLDADSPNVTGTLTGFGTRSMAYTASGALLTGGNDGTVRLWRWPLPQADGALPGDNTKWAVSPGGNLMAAPVEDPADPPLGIWNLAAPDGPALVSDLSMPGGLESVQFLNERALLTVDHNGAVRLWDVSDPSHPVQTASLGIANFLTQGEFIAATEVTTNTAGTLVAVAGSDNKLHLWKIDGALHATEIGSVSVPDTTDDFAGILADGYTAFSTTPTGIDWWDTTDPTHPAVGGTSPLSGANQGSFFSAGNVFAATSSQAAPALSSSLHLFELAHGRPQSAVTLASQIGSSAELGMSDDGDLVAVTGAAGNTINLWDTTDPKHPRDLAAVATGQNVADITFDPSDRTMADWGTVGGAVQVWNISNPNAPTLEYTVTPPGGSSDVTAGGFTPSGAMLAVAYDSGSTYLLDTNPAALADQLCSYTGDSITQAEWQQNAPGIAYQNPCP